MVITLLQHGDSRKQAFARGLAKGMAAPLMLFSANQSHVGAVELAPLPSIDPVRVPRSLTTMTDLERIGADFWAVVQRHEQEIAQQQPAVGAEGDRSSSQAGRGSSDRSP